MNIILVTFRFISQVFLIFIKAEIVIVIVIMVLTILLIFKRNVK